MTKTHGMSKTKEYKTWVRIRDKCYNDSHISYAKYGGAGIEFEYKDSFVDFLEEVGRCPEQSKEWSIDRIDPALGYVKGNMRWLPTRKQAQNRRKASNNTTGFTGVYKHRNRWRAEWWVDGIKQRQSFSTFEDAVSHRKAMIAELVENGELYTEHHGM